MFKNGKAAVVTLKNDERINNTLLIDVQEMDDENTDMEVGYFIKVQNDLLFINNNYTIKLTNV